VAPDTGHVDRREPGTSGPQRSFKRVGDVKRGDGFRISAGGMPVSDLTMIAFCCFGNWSHSLIHETSEITSASAEGAASLASSTASLGRSAPSSSPSPVLTPPVPEHHLLRRASDPGQRIVDRGPTLKALQHDVLNDHE